MFEDVETALTADSRQRRRNCGFTHWVEGLEPKDRETAEQLVFNRAYNCRALARYFQSKGAIFNDQVVNRHRNGQCCGQVR